MTQDELKELALEIAPVYPNVTKMLKYGGISRKSYYKACNADPDFKTKLLSILGSQVTKAVSPKDVKLPPTQKIVGNTDSGATPITVQVYPPPEEGDTSKKHSTEADRIVSATKICDMIRYGATLNDACSILKVSPTSFLSWRAHTSPLYSKHIEEMYNDAKQQFKELYTNDIRMKARKLLADFLQVKTVTNTTKIGRVDETGKVIPHTIRKDTKEIVPTINAIRLALEMTEAGDLPMDPRLQVNVQNNNQNNATFIKGGNTAEKLDNITQQEEELQNLLNNDEYGV